LIPNHQSHKRGKFTKQSNSNLENKGVPRPSETINWREQQMKSRSTLSFKWNKARKEQDKITEDLGESE
jgi:hypothetical protein